MDRRFRLISAFRNLLMGDPASLSGARLRRARSLPFPDVPVLSSLNAAFVGRAPDGVEVSEIEVPGAAGSLPARLHRPSGAGPDAPVVLYLHGGGWVVNSPALYEWICGRLAEGLGAVVIAPDYRKAPEHPAPAPLEDCMAVTRWLLSGDGPATLGVSGPLVVGGDSAGGSLSALVALAVRDEGLEGLAAQLLIYPSTDLTNDTDSHRELTDEPFLPREHMQAFTALYLGGYGAGAIKPDDPRVSPLRADDVSGVAPACVVIAERDPLRDEGRAYAERLSAAGVQTRLTEYADVPHAFVSLPTVTPLAGQAVADMIAFAHRQIAAGAA